MQRQIVTRSAALVSTIALFLAPAARSAGAQLAPEIGYVYPSGGRAGTTVDVMIGGYDWTPDTQLFVHHPEIKLEITGPPSEVLVPPPPYWFGAKARGPAWPLPREFPARLTIPEHVNPGIIRFQAANANGASPAGSFQVGDLPEVCEDDARKTPQPLGEIPMVVNGQIRLIEEVDRYEFVAPASGPVTVELFARRLGSPLHGLLKIRDDQRRVVVDQADTEGKDLAVSFIARAGTKYLVSLHDLDFAGDRSYVYRLAITPGSRVMAAYPAAGPRGQKQSVEFFGLGLATGVDRVESATQVFPFPAQLVGDRVTCTIGTPFGATRPIVLSVSDLPELVEPVGARETTLERLPCAVTGSLESRNGADRFVVPLKKGENWRIEVHAEDIGSPLDPELALLGPDGKEIASNDDSPGSTNPLLFVTAAADGPHTLVVTDRSGKSGGRDANYRLTIEPQREDFAISCPQHLAAPLGGSLKLPVKAVRLGGFQGPIHLALADLPPGVSTPAGMMIPEGKTEVNLELPCAADAPAAASLATLSGTGRLGEQMVTRSAERILFATILKPRIKIVPEGLDDVRKVHRGSTFFAPLLIERLEGFQGEITLEMTAKQQRHRQGLASRELVVPAGAARVEYPIFVPEWMETTKTSRMILNGVAKVPDPRGNVRTLVQRMEMRIGILPEGALLKLSAAGGEISAHPGAEFHIPLTISRAPELHGPLMVEFIPDASQTGLVLAEPVRVAAEQREVAYPLRLADDARLIGQQPLTFRATAHESGRGPVISETTVIVPVAKPPPSRGE